MAVGRYNIGEKVWVKLWQDNWPTEEDKSPDDAEKTIEDIAVFPRSHAIVLPASTTVRRRQQYVDMYPYREMWPGREMYLPGKILCKSVCRTMSDEEYNLAGGRIQYCVHVPGRNESEPEGFTRSNNLDDLVVPSLNADILSNDYLPGLEVLVVAGDPIIPQCKKHNIENMICDTNGDYCRLQSHYHTRQHAWTNRAGYYTVRHACTIRALGP